MFCSRTSSLVACLSWLVAATPSVASQPDSSVLYELSSVGSELQVGCQAPCACPIASLPARGSLVLVSTSADPLYNYYDVERFTATLQAGAGLVSVSGSGHYQVGGEVALVQRMTLDLQIGSLPVQHFDSGLVPVSASGPQLDIACAVHEFFCFDSVLVLKAKPVATSGGPPPPGAAAGLRQVQPNPFQAGASIVFSMDRTAPVDLVITDLAGRRLRVLAEQHEFAAGEQRLNWDGRQEDGSRLPAGTYWVRMRWPGGADARRIVKID